MNNKLALTLACADYDRTAALRTGDVPVEGVALNYLTLPVEETFFRMVTNQEFDLSELSLSTYVMTLSSPESPFVALPVFPSKMFRHSGIYVNTDAGIETPADLRGRVVGIPEYQVTAAVWIRGILEEHYDVPVNSVRYMTGGLHKPGRVEKFSLSLPADVDVQPIADDATLSEMLISGQIDALYSPRTPKPFAEGHPKVRRLFKNSGEEERKYFNATGIFPIMHVVALRRDVYEANRWVARSLQNAFEQARSKAMDGIDETASSRYMLPWLFEEVERTREAMGTDYWTYGLDSNQKNLATFLRYSYEQGLADRLYEPADLFAPETLTNVVV